MDTIGFIGGGNMAEALIKGIIGAEVCSSSDIIVSDIRDDRLNYLVNEYGVNKTQSNTELVEKAEIIVLSIKPQTMSDVLDEIKSAVSSQKLVISIAAGITTKNIADKLGDVSIIRVMPNTPALVGEGASALYSKNASVESMETALKLFSSVGKAVVVQSEGLIDAVTAVSGSGPAYYFLLMEEMIKTAQKLGLDDKTAKDLVLQTAKGASILAEQADTIGETPAELRKKVTSPGGTTEAALNVFRNEDFGQLVEEALTAAGNRSKELSG